MWAATLRAVRDGLLVLPDVDLDEPARLDGAVLRFNPDRRGVGIAVSRILDANPGHPRCAVLLALVAREDAEQAAMARWRR